MASFEEFFRTYEEIPNEFKYRKKISEAYSKSEEYIVVLFEDILNFDPNLAYYLKKYPEQALGESIDAFKNILRFDTGGVFNADLEYFVRISTQNNSNEIKLRDIRASHIDNLIYVRGIIIRASDVRPQLINATVECPLCGNLTQEPQLTHSIKLPRECTNPSCKNTRDFKIITEDSEFIDYQVVTLQEAPEELKPGAIPKMTQTVLRHGLVDTVRPGERVKVMGILKSIPKEDRRGKLSTVFFNQIFANHIEGLSQEDDEVDITEEDLQEIMSLSREPMIQKKIARSIARAILGHDELKMAAALSLFGGNQKIKSDGSKLRGDIHVLFIGDPGTGKSQILQNCAQIASRSIYTSGKGASAAGLTAAVVKESDNSGMQLEAGALALASGGIAAIDEFDKMKVADRSAIHEAMEQQTISIAKAGIVATLQAKTAIIAAANPKMGRWDDFSNPIENINLTPPILSRFDLIFVVRDTPEPDQDERIASYILQNHMEGMDENSADETDDSGEKVNRDYIPMDLLKKYIRHMKNNCFPKLSKKAANKIKEFYVRMRNMNQDGTAVAIVARNLESLVRMSESYAKMANKPIVSVSHVDDVLRLEEKHLKDIGYDEETGTYDVDILQSGQSRSKTSKLMTILNVIKEFQMEDPSPLEFEDIYEPLSSKGFKEEFVREALTRWVSEGLIYNPKPTTFALTEKPRKKKKTPKVDKEQTE